MNNLQRFVKKNSSNILTVATAAGMITTTILAVKATPKALELIKAEEDTRKITKTTTLYADNQPYTTAVVVEETPKLTPLEIVKVAWKPYVPAIAMGALTLTCLFGMNYLNRKTQASLISAYAVLEKSYRQYREKCIEMYNADTDIDIKQKIAKSNFYKNIEVEDGKELFFDYTSMQYFESTMDEVKEALDTINETLSDSGFVYLNDFYELLGIPLVDYGYNLGWFSDIGTLKLDYEKTELDDGDGTLDCWIITPTESPMLHLY